MRNKTPICFYCGSPIYDATRSDQMFCNKRHRYLATYIPVPKCKECLIKDCPLRNEKRKYSPKDCQLRG